MKADVIAFHLFFVADVKPHFYYMLQQLKMADVIAKWQMEWPLQGGDW